MMPSEGSFLAEMKRRRVYQTGTAYVVGALALWGAADFAAGAFGWSDRALQLLILVSVAGLPVVLAAAWLFDIRREQGDVGPWSARRLLLVTLGLSAIFVSVGYSLMNMGADTYGVDGTITITSPGEWGADGSGVFEASERALRVTGVGRHPQGVRSVSVNGQEAMVEPMSDGDALAFVAFLDATILDTVVTVVADSNGSSF
jgi:hypothetical protein